MKNVIITDLDGTLADIAHRRHFVEKPSPCNGCNNYGKVILGDGYPEKASPCPKCKGASAKKPDWPAFFKACVDDTPLNTTITLISATMGLLDFTYGKEAQLIIVSGRSDEVRADTEKWLEAHGVIYDQLIMRKAGDYTPDDKLKEGWLLDGTLPAKDKIFCVFEDRARVVDVWRRHGLQCYQVADGDF